MDTVLSHAFARAFARTVVSGAENRAVIGAPVHRRDGVRRRCSAPTRRPGDGVAERTGVAQSGLGSLVCELGPRVPLGGGHALRQTRVLRARQLLVPPRPLRAVQSWRPPRRRHGRSNRVSVLSEVDLDPAWLTSATVKAQDHLDTTAAYCVAARRSAAGAFAQRATALGVSQVIGRHVGGTGSQVEREPGKATDHDPGGTYKTARPGGDVARRLG